MAGVRSIRALVLLATQLAAQPADPTLAAIRDYARNYVQNLPNYTAIQSIKRKVKNTPALGVRARDQTDEIEEQIGYANHRESHKILRANGRAMGAESPVRNEGVFSTGEFGGILETLSSDRAGATFQPAKPEKINGRRADVYEFQVPADPGGYGIKQGGRTTRVAFVGRMWADAASHAVLRVQLRLVDFPPVLRYKSLELTLDFAPAKVGGQEFVLPARYSFKTRTEDSDATLDAVYRDYQRFSADSTIIFDEP